MSRLSVFRNIVFGELRDPAYAPARLADNREFLDFLDRSGLTDPLVSLGRDLAVRTVSLLKDVERDDYFFRNSPIDVEEFDAYQRIVNRLETYGIDGLREPERSALLTLALRYVPVRHKMAAIPAGLRERILKARHRFMAEKGGIDMDRCRQVSDGFIRGGNIPAETPPDAEYAIYCPENYLQSRPLLDNIIFGTPRSDDAADAQALSEMVIGLLEEADLLDAVMDIGLDFQVGSKGDRLSGGQKQKIAIARALLKKPPILIMDEATASLDNVSQRRIQAYIEDHLRGRTTVVAVLHRLDMTPGYDQIMVLKGGRVMETGDYDTLMAQKGAFYDLVEGHG
jgi:putative ABC transport system ATP-binding protein